MAELKRAMGFWAVSALAFLNLVNTGLFFGVQVGVSADVGGSHAGLNSLIGWGFLAILSIYIAMCFGELTSMFPSAGGVYEFAKQAYGRFPSFLIGWILWVAGNIATALFTVAAVELMLGGATITIGTVIIQNFVAKIILSAFIIILFNYIAYRGIEASEKLMIVLASFMLLIIVFIIVTGAFGIQVSHLTGITFNTSLTLISMFFLAETFFGWEAASYMSEETKDAARTIPRALILTTVLVAIAAVLVAVVTIGTLGVDALLRVSPHDAIQLLLEHAHFTPQIMAIIGIGVIVALLGNASGNIITLPRLLLALSRDKLFIEQFSDIHPTHQTPYKGIIFQTVVATAIVVFAAATYQQLLALLVPISLVLYASIILLVPYFRWTRKDEPRTFRVPFGRVLPLLISLFFLVLLGYWALNEPGAVGQLRLLASFVFFSIPIYLLLTYFYDPDSLISTLSFLSRLNLWLENILIPKRVRRDIIDFFTNATGKHVLEFGSGVGTLTKHLADHVGRHGKVYAVDLSKVNADIIRKRMSRLGHTHVQVIHDPHLVNRVHPDVKSADIIISLNNLSYIQDFRKVLREMNQILPPQGRICFVEYVDLFYFIPNPKWLTDADELKRIFREAGFSVTVTRRRGILWNYLTIVGIKDSRGGVYI